MSEQQTPPPSPELFFQTVNAYQRTAAIKAAVELDLFTAVAGGARTPAELAARLSASERGVRVLCDYLVVIGFLTKEGGSYGLTPDSAAFLNRRSPAYMGGAIEFLLADTLKAGFDDLAAVVRKGGTIINDEGGTVSPDNPVWVKFARAMAPMVEMPAQAMARLAAEPGRPQKVLDIAAGHGVFGIRLAQANPQAEVVALDWPAVLEVAKENARAAGVEGRYTTLEGSAFELDFGTGYDVVLLTNFLHHFDPATCETLLRKIRAALRDGGRVLTLEFVPNDDRVSPPIPAAFSLQMLGGTEAGDAYTFKELESMFRNAGFSRSELHDLTPSPQKLVVSYK